MGLLRGSTSKLPGSLRKDHYPGYCQDWKQTQSPGRGRWLCKRERRPTAHSYALSMSSDREDLGAAWKLNDKSPVGNYTQCAQGRGRGAPLLARWDYIILAKPVSPWGFLITVPRPQTCTSSWTCTSLPPPHSVVTASSAPFTSFIPSLVQAAPSVPAWSQQPPKRSPCSQRPSLPDLSVPSLFLHSSQNGLWAFKRITGLSFFSVSSSLL